MYPSEILFTIFVNAIGRAFKNWNLDNAVAKQIIATADEIGAIYTVTSIIFNAPSKLSINGNIIPTKNSPNCSVNTPEFLLKNFIKLIIDTKYKK